MGFSISPTKSESLLAGNLRTAQKSMWIGTGLRTGAAVARLGPAAAAVPAPGHRDQRGVLEERAADRPGAHGAVRPWLGGGGTLTSIG